MPDSKADGSPIGLSVEEGIVDEIVYRSEESGYTVSELAVSDDRAMVAVGIMPYLARGESVRLFGEWTRHPEYGDQFKVVRYETVAPRTEDAILHYLSSGIVHGVGDKLAARIVARFGADSLRVMREEPDKLAAVRGIGADAAQRISNEMRDKQEYQELALLLSSFGIGADRILRIHRQFGSRALETVRENPFRLADEVYGIGFHTADQIARSLNCAPDSPYRMRSAIRYVLSQGAAAGHTSLPESMVIDQSSRLLGLRVALDDPDYIRMKTSGQIVASEPSLTETRIAIRSLHEAERNLAERLAVLSSCEPPPVAGDLDGRLDQLSADMGVELAEEQRSAVLLAARSGVCVITGGPGTGKTTIIRFLCRLFDGAQKKVLLAAPTGQAAKRMSLASGMDARTIHRMLETQFTGDDGEDRMAGPKFRRNPSNPLEADVLVVDEVSMADVLLLNSVVAALRPGARLILVGDADQLPSVGPGNALRDILASGIIPSVRLLRIFRQADSGRIVSNAHRINHGDYPEFDQRDDSDFLYIPRRTPEEMADAAVRLCSTILSGRYGYDPMRDIQVIAPSRKGPSGIPVLNRALQAALNPLAAEGKPGITAHGFRFSVGDRVMQVSNNYELEWKDTKTPPSSGTGIFNGETGIVLSVDENEGQLKVGFDEDRRVEYDRALMDELEPAYAVTVHKSQGSEYPVVVLVLPPGPPMLLTRNLLYTAVTRAKERLFLISSGDVLGRTVANARRNERFTALEGYLKMRAPPVSSPSRSPMHEFVPAGWSALAAQATTMARSALAALYPSKCVLCGRTDRLVPDAGGCCVVCLARLPHRRPPDRLLPCRTRPDPRDRLSGLPVIAAMYYESPLRDLLLRLKFSRDAGLHPMLSATAVRALRMEHASLPVWPDVVAAVPLHRDRLRERGFNQSELLAQGVARAIGAVDRSDALLRIRATRRQSSVSGRTERDANLSGAFRVLDPLAFRGRSILIVDDVLTSGATMQACAEAIARFSPAALTGLVVACGRSPSLRIDSVPYER